MAFADAVHPPAVMRLLGLLSNPGVGCGCRRIDRAVLIDQLLQAVGRIRVTELVEFGESLFHLISSITEVVLDGCQRHEARPNVNDRVRLFVQFVECGLYLGLCAGGVGGSVRVRTWARPWPRCRLPTPSRR